MVPAVNVGSSDTLVLVLQGLGLCPKEFEAVVKKYLPSRGANIKLSCPPAPKRPVTYVGGKVVHAWFDIAHTPIATDDVHDGLAESVRHVHDLIRRAEAAGFSADRILLAGYSQGATLALTAGLTYEHRLAGICSLSGWVPAGLIAHLKQTDVPILMHHGESDTLIPVETCLKSARALKDAGCRQVDIHRQPQLKHNFGNPQQMERFKCFVLSKVPSGKSRFIPVRAATPSTNAGSDSSENECASSSDDDRPRIQRNSQPNGLVRCHSRPAAVGPARLSAQAKSVHSASEDSHQRLRGTTRANAMQGDILPGPCRRPSFDLPRSSSFSTSSLMPKTAMPSPRSDTRPQLVTPRSPLMSARSLSVLPGRPAQNMIVPLGGASPVLSPRLLLF